MGNQDSAKPCTINETETSRTPLGSAIASPVRKLQNRNLEPDCIPESSGASKPDIREVEKLHVRAKRSADEASRQRQLLLNRERMRRLRAGRRQAKERGMLMSGESPVVQAAEAHAIPHQADHSYEVQELVQGAVVQMAEHQGLDA